MTGLIFTFVFTSVNFRQEGSQHRNYLLRLTVEFVAIIITLLHMICNKVVDARVA